MRMLKTHAAAIFSVIVFILMRFRPSALIRYVSGFKSKCVFDENADFISVMYVFSNENVLL